MNIPGYKYISHKIVPRRIGDECRFTVLRESDGFEISDTVPAQADLEALSAAITAFLTRTSEPIEQSQVSFVDAEIEAIKERTKTTGCLFIKHFPNCSEAEFLQSFFASLPYEEAQMAQTLMKLHITGAHMRGLITEATFVTFRDFVAKTPTDLLMSM